MRKNVLILGHNDAPQFIDIFNQYTALFDREKYAVTVAYLTGAPDEKTRQRTLAENVLFLNLKKQQVRTLKIGAVKKLLALCREENFSIVICHRYKPTYIMLWVAQFCKIPALIFVMHELKTMASLKRQLLIRALWRKNMMFAGVSNAVRDDMRKYLWMVPKEQVQTLYNVIDVELNAPQLLSKEAARNALQLAAEDIIFGNVGRLVPNKDQKNLIQAFSLIKPLCPKAKLIIIGNGGLSTQLQQQIQQLGLQNEVILTGFLADSFRYMQAFDCFVLSSKQEAFGRVLLEAMIAKLPLIATRANGIPEVVNDAGMLVPAMDATKLAEALRQMYLFSNTERQQQGEKAYQRMLNYFSLAPFKKYFWQLPLLATIKE